MRITEEYVFFYKDWIANFHQAPFVHYTPFGPCPQAVICQTSEQAFQFDKARYFGDIELANVILQCDDPKVALVLGNRVKGFDSERWSKVRFAAMSQAVREKFSGNFKLAMRLLDPVFDGKTFVEASPIDKYWGIGLAENDPAVTDPNLWKGSNMLGTILTDLRDKLAERAELARQENGKV